MRAPHRLAAALALPLLLASCGGDGDGDREADTSGAITEQQLEDALLPVGTEVAGWTVSEPQEWDTEPSDRSAEPEGCLALAVLPLEDIEPVSWGTLRLEREVPGRLLGDRVEIGVMSFGGDGAARTFRALDQAIDECAGGFTLELPLNTIDVDEIARRTDPGLGDESVTVVLEAASVMEGHDDCDSTLTAIRQGNDLIWRDTGFHCEVSAFTGDGIVQREALALPRKVVKAQLTRLSRARS